MDFGGEVPGNVAVTSTSYGFRIRQAFLDYTRGSFEVTGGQLFSLMTPLKGDLLPWPGDVATTQVIDTNYVPGLVFGRYPQVRFVYHASKSAALGFSIENPEQNVGSSSATGVIFPTALASTLNNQYNTGSNGLKVPNLMPDFVVKLALNGGHGLHLDFGGLLREFRNFNPMTGNGVTNHIYATGWGLNANLAFEIIKKTRLVANAFWGDGSGRYIGGLVPDVIVRANGNISTIRAYSWIGGFEIAPNKATGIYMYYSGNYGQKNTAVDTTGKLIGWGFVGAANVADRYVQEATGGYSKTLWKQENLGSVQIGFQYAYVFLAPWSPGSGPSQAHTNMFFTQLRYNLP
jgi:hypothetical protein